MMDLLFVSAAGIDRHVESSRSTSFVQKPSPIWSPFAQSPKSRRTRLCIKASSSSEDSPAASSAASDVQPVPARNTSSMKMASATSRKLALGEALADAASQALFRLGLEDSQVPSLALVFVSTQYGMSPLGSTSATDSLSAVVPKLRSFIPGLKTVVGCTCPGAVGTTTVTGPADPAGPMQRNSQHKVEEVENDRVVSLTLFYAPEIEFRTFSVAEDDMSQIDLDSSPEKWASLVVGNQANTSEFAGAYRASAMILFADPTFKRDGTLANLLTGLDFAYPAAIKLGGMASASGPGSGHLFCTLRRDVLQQTSPAIYGSGVVGVALFEKHINAADTPVLKIETLSSHGCRAIGPVFEIKESSKNMMHKVCAVPSSSSASASSSSKGYSGLFNAEMSAAGSLRYLFERATQMERDLMQKGQIFVGVSCDLFSDDIDGDDNVVLGSLIGVDGKDGNLALGMSNMIRPGQRFRYFIRDQMDARERLYRRLSSYKAKQLSQQLTFPDAIKDNDTSIAPTAAPNAHGSSYETVGVLMFVDALRGKALYRESDWESSQVKEFVTGGCVPVSGIFTESEIGPIGLGSQKPTPTYVQSFSTTIAILSARSSSSSS